MKIAIKAKQIVCTAESCTFLGIIILHPPVVAVAVIVVVAVHYVVVVFIVAVVAVSIEF